VHADVQEAPTRRQDADGPGDEVAEGRDVGVGQHGQAEADGTVREGERTPVGANHGQAIAGMSELA